MAKKSTESEIRELLPFQCSNLFVDVAIINLALHTPVCFYAVVGSFCWTIAVLVAQIICWTGQFIGHGVFEKRAPALLDNLVQAFVMAPFFVLLEALQTSFGYEPYPGFHASVQAKIGAQIKEWKENKKLKLHS
ncbi:YGL010W-LIKE PROTEIN [Salix purpurea]|uniref:YGL010W-LIKE PROTEIN n=1 Tax=Salix purpurea TaxID=77065 RepID=A0A9Q0TV28_SALPP|nr:YGL010W-LIKE PROTEIN [Salix purpurea]